MLREVQTAIGEVATGAIVLLIFFLAFFVDLTKSAVQKEPNEGGAEYIADKMEYLLRHMSRHIDAEFRDVALTELISGEMEFTTSFYPRPQHH